MKRSIVASAAAAAALSLAALAGCESAGLSPREVPGRTQSAYLYSLYAEMPPEARNAPQPPPRLPASVAVVQVGEAAPPAPLLEAMRGDPGVFGRVESLPGIAYEGEPWDRNRRRADGLVDARGHLTALRSLAADMGLDYLLLVGGTVDYGTTATELSLLDLSIVGAFVIPSHETNATARANGALVDVRTGRVAVNSAAEASSKSTVSLVKVEGEQMKLLTALRDEVVAKLGKRVIEDTRLRAVSGWTAAAAAGGAPAPSGAFPAAPPARHLDAAPAGDAQRDTGLPPVPRTPHAQHYDTAGR
jgi:hypothetical protein